MTDTTLRDISVLPPISRETTNLRYDMTSRPSVFARELREQNIMPLYAIICLYALSEEIRLLQMISQSLLARNYKLQTAVFVMLMRSQQVINVSPIISRPLCAMF